VDNTKSVLENKSVTCIKDKEKNDIKLVDTCNFNARNVNENIEPLLIERYPLWKYFVDYISVAV
jgi:hypothetical protein